jgi:hypothetical protein
MEETTRTVLWLRAAQNAFRGSAMTHLGQRWTGVCLNDNYKLRHYMEEPENGGGNAAFFEGEDSSGSAVLVEVLDAAAEGSRQRLEIWRRAIHLQHPHLLRLLDYGEADALPPGRPCYYAVFERPQENLAAALEQSPLTERDARELLLATLDALRYLHAQGLVHGSIQASNILAVDDTIKLATADLHEPGDEPFTYSGDIGAVGALLYRVLTGSEFGRGADLSGISQPLATIIRNTAGAAPADRWRIPEVLAILPPEEPEVVPEESAIEVASEVPATEAPLPYGRGSDMSNRGEVERVAPSEDSPAHDQSRLPASTAVVGADTASYQPPAAPHSVPRWAWPVSIAAIVGCIAWVVHTPPHKAVSPAAQPPAVSAPRPQQEIRPQSAPLAPQPEPPAPVQASAAQERPVWRVIAYTYNAFHDAQKKVLAINQKWPGLHAEVFAPKGSSHAPYLVALGGRMNRLEAARILQRARSRGLPRDTFMLNFSD